MSPLNSKGKKIMRSMKRTYGSEKAKRVFYASENSGKIRGVARKQPRRSKRG